MKEKFSEGVTIIQTRTEEIKEAIPRDQVCVCVCVPYLNYYSAVSLVLALGVLEKLAGNTQIIRRNVTRGIIQHSTVAANIASRNCSAEENRQRLKKLKRDGVFHSRIV